MRERRNGKVARSTAETVEQYLEELPEERRETLSTVRDLVLEHLPAGYREAMNWGMISYEVPLTRCPETYNGQPLMYAALAAQKNHFSLYLMALDGEGEQWLKEAFGRAGTKLDMGKSCVRFRWTQDLPLAVIADAVARTAVDDFVALYERGRKTGG